MQTNLDSKFWPKSVLKELGAGWVVDVLIIKTWPIWKREQDEQDFYLLPWPQLCSPNKNRISIWKSISNVIKLKTSLFGVAASASCGGETTIKEQEENYEKNHGLTLTLPYSFRSIVLLNLSRQGT